MRILLNAILTIIGSTSLTDEEFEGMDVDDQSNDRDVYEALLLVLDARESITDFGKRVKYYYLAKGISFDSTVEQTIGQGKSNIFVGSKL